MSNKSQSGSQLRDAMSQLTLKAIEENKDTQQPVENEDTQQPVENEDTQQPVENEDTQQPVENEDTQQPVENKDTQQPVENEDTQQPVENKDTQQPVENKDTQQPVENEDTQQPVEEAQQVISDDTLALLKKTDSLEPQSLPPMPPLKKNANSSSSLVRQFSTNSYSSNDGTWNENIRHSAKQRRVPKSTASFDSTVSVNLQLNETDVVERDQEKELIRQLSGALAECSRQRLRSIQMSFRSSGTGETRITAKELYQVLIDNQVKITSRVYQLILNLYEDSFGINYEKMWHSLVLGHISSGRDSVLAQTKKNQDQLNNSGRIISQEDRDVDLVRRLEEQLLGYREPYDLDEVKNGFQAKDKDKCGKIKRDEMEQTIMDCDLPLYGALFTALLSRCDDEKNGKVSWPEMMGFLDRAKLNLMKKGIMTKEDFVKLQARRKEFKQEQNKKSAGMTSIQEQGNNAKKEPSNQTLKKVPSSDKLPDPLAKEIVRQAFQQAVAAPDGEMNCDLNSSDVMKIKSSLKEKSGFLRSMKSLLTGKKRSDLAGSPTPLLPQDGNSEKTTPVATPTVSRPVSKTTSQGLKASPSNTSRPTSATTLTPVSPSPLPSPKVPNNRPLTEEQKNKDVGGKKTPAVTNQILSSTGKLAVQLNGKSVEFDVPDSFNANNVSTDPPQERLQLEWVYGYRGHDTRSNVHILNTNEIVYFIGTVVVLYNREEHKQRHYREHTYEIRSIAVHPNKMTLASGQSDSTNPKENIQAHVRVWRCDTLQTMYILGINIFYKSVVCLAFSATQEKLCAVDDSPEHFISVWDVSVGKFITKAPLGVDYVCDIDFQPRDPAVVAVIGREHLGWWKIQTEPDAIELLWKAEYQTYLRPRFVTCMWHSERDDLITGDSNGTVYVWGHGGSIITNLMKHAHYGPILCLTVTRGHIITGGRDCSVKAWMWSKNMDLAGKLEVPTSEGGVRMLVVHKDKLLIGTTNNSIMMATLSGSALRNPFSGIILNTVKLTQGHVGDIRGLCVPPDPEGPEVMLTAGIDGNICAYDTKQKMSLWKCPFKDDDKKKVMKIACIDCNFNGTLLAFATLDNSVHMFGVGKDEEDVLLVEEVFNVNVCKSTSQMSSLCVIKLAPDCSKCVVGHSNGCISVIGLTLGADDQMVWDVLLTSKCHPDRITGIDWSIDQYDETYLIRTSCSTFGYALWKTNTLKEIKNQKEYIKVKWASVCCKVLYSTIGVWFSKQAAESNVSAIGVNPQQTLVAMGDTRGYLSLFRYPCCRKGECDYIKQHVNVSCLQFTSTETCLLISTGNNPKDSSTLQWTYT